MEMAAIRKFNQLSPWNSLGQRSLRELVIHAIEPDALVERIRHVTRLQ